MSDLRIDLEERFNAKREELSALEERVVERDRLKRELQAVESELQFIPSLKEEIQAIFRIMNALDREAAQPAPSDAKNAESCDKQQEKSDWSVPDLALLILRTQQRPLDAKELTAEMIVAGKNVDVKTVTGQIYYHIKRRQKFSLVRPGVFGLLEWEGPEIAE